MSYMDWRSLQYFCAVVRSGSILSAAAALGVTATTVRSAIDRLEDQFGKRLLRRTHGGVELTNAGKDIYAKVLEASKKLDQIGNTDHHTDELLPNCRVSCSVIFFRTILSERIDELIRLEEKVHFLIEPIDTLRNLNDEEIDISIRHKQPVQETFVAIKAGTINFAIFAPRRTKNREDALSNYPYATTPTEREFARSIGLEQVYSQIKRPVTFYSYGHLSEVVQNGSCVGILPEKIGNGCAHLKKLSPDMAPIEVPIWICRKRTTSNSRRVRRGFRALRTVISAALTEEASN